MSTLAPTKASGWLGTFGTFARAGRMPEPSSHSVRPLSLAITYLAKAVTALHELTPIESAGFSLFAMHWTPVAVQLVEC